MNSYKLINSKIHSPDSISSIT